MHAPCVVRAEVAHHHAEAVVERHRDADPVIGGVSAALADEVAVVEDVVVRQRRTLGEAGSAAGVLDVDRVVEGQARLALGQDLGVGGRALRNQPVPVRGADVDDLLQVWQVAADFVDHGAVVAGLEALGADEQPGA